MSWKTIGLKKIQRLSLVLFILLCITSHVTNASAENINFIPLSNSKILSIVKKNSGDDWQYFQPSPRETDVNCSSEAFLKRINIYPILALKDDQNKLILLKKDKGAWKYLAENPLALKRDDFELTSFSIDENVNIDDQHLNVFFEFYSKQYNNVSLLLLMNQDFSYFRSIDVTLMNSSRIQKTTSFEPYRGFTFITDYYTDYATCPFSTSYYVGDSENRSFSAEEFDFSSCPIVINELYQQITCIKEIQLYSAPSLDACVNITVLPGETIYVITSDQYQEWTIIEYNKVLFFCKNLQLL